MTPSCQRRSLGAAPLATVEVLQRLETALVVHLPMAVDPVAEIEIGQAEGLGLGDMVEDHIGPQRQVGQIGVVEAVNHRQTVSLLIRQAGTDQFTQSAETAWSAIFNDIAVNTAKKQSSAKTEKLNAAIDMLIESDADLSTVLGKEGLIKQLSKRILERALEAEMQSHLGYERYNRSDIENARNGSYQKNLITNNGQIELNVPRDRKGQFEPVIVKKKQSRIDGLDEKIISLYAKGMSISDIKIQLEELYGAEVSESLISRVTDDVIEEVKAWQSRALEAVYPIVFFDCLVVKVRQDKRIINKSVYIALGIDLSGHKDILGLWISDNEGAKFWLNNLTEMKNRGVLDILIACTDNLTGMSEAISAVYPKCEH